MHVQRFSVGNLHTPCQIPMTCLCTSLFDWLHDRGTAVNFSSFLAKFLFFMGHERLLRHLIQDDSVLGFLT